MGMLEPKCERGKVLGHFESMLFWAMADWIFQFLSLKFLWTITANDQKLKCSVEWKISWGKSLYAASFVELNEIHIRVLIIVQWKILINFWKEKGFKGGWWAPADLNHFHCQRSHHSYYTAQLTSFLTCFSLLWQKTGSFLGANVHWMGARGELFQSEGTFQDVGCRLHKVRRPTRH